MRMFAFAVGAALVLAGCGAAPGQPEPQAFQTKFLNLASITNQVADMTNIGVNTQVNVPVVVTPITQVSALSWGNQSANPNVNLPINQDMNVNVSQLMTQFGASL